MTRAPLLPLLALALAALACRVELPVIEPTPTPTATAQATQTPWVVTATPAATPQQADGWRVMPTGTARPEP